VNSPALDVRSSFSLNDLATFDAAYLYLKFVNRTFGTRQADDFSFSPDPKAPNGTYKAQGQLAAVTLVPALQSLSGPSPEIRSL
jgi:hypothetical protein